MNNTISKPRLMSERTTGAALDHALSLQPSGVNFCGYLRTESGVGAAARGYVRAIKSAGLPMALLDISDLQTNRSHDSSLTGFRADFPYDVNLVCADVELHYAILTHLGEEFFKDRYNIGIWAWELPRVPKKWFDRFAYYDEIWVASSFIFDALSAVSPVPVVRMPPVLTPETYGSRERGRERLRAAEDFIFLFVFDFHSHSERKNPLAAVEAFRKAFSPSDSSRLIIKCVNGASKPQDYARLKQKAQGARIEIHEGYWPAEEVRDLVAACDAYVSLHRSEGTGLTITDAMAHGKPVIATGWSGNMDFMSVSNSYPVRYELVKVGENVGPYQAGEIWAEPSVEHATECMRAVFERRKEAAERGRVAERDIRCNYSVEPVAARIVQRMEAVKIRRGFDEFRREIQDHFSNYMRLGERIQKSLIEQIPRQSRVLVVSKGDDRLVNLSDYEGWHFPQDVAGVYAGYYPANSQDAIRHLEELREKGADFLLFPSSAFWWLDKYEDFARHLTGKYHRLVESEHCVIYDLALDSLASAKLEQHVQQLADRQAQIQQSISALVTADQTTALAVGGAKGASQSHASQQKAVSKDEPYQQLIRRVRETVQAVIPRQAHLLVISKGDPELLNQHSRVAAHFPQAASGAYAGHYPADSAAAIAQLELLKTAMNCYLLIPTTSFWWLGHYVDFRRHLETHYQRFWNDDACLIYDLTPRSAKNGSTGDSVSAITSTSTQSTSVSKVDGLLGRLRNRWTRSPLSAGRITR